MTHHPLKTCKRGHLFDAANTHIRKNGKWACRECSRYRKTIYRRKAGISKRVSAYERFRLNVYRAGDCWLWTGTRNNNGYGVFCADGKRQYVHRWIWQEFHYPNGSIPPEREIDHLCRNRACVNPSHMELVTHQENMRRGFFGQKTHCLRGHPLKGRNLAVYKSGKRYCRACGRIRYRERKIRETL